MTFQFVWILTFFFFLPFALKQARCQIYSAPFSVDRCDIAARIIFDVVESVGCRVKLWFLRASGNRLWMWCGPGLSWRKALLRLGSHCVSTEPLLEANLPPWHTNCWSFTVLSLPYSNVNISKFLIEHVCFYWVNECAAEKFVESTA